VPLGNKEDDDGAELGGARVLIASLLGLAAACWPDRPDRDVGAPWRVGRVNLLARADGPTAPRDPLEYDAMGRSSEFRGNVTGAPLFERLTDEGRGRALELDDRERRLWSAARRCRIEIDAMAADGELVATGGPVEAWIDGAALPDPADAAPDRR
jgi:hypothetical protein